jgi:hypothetical protein
MINELAGHLWWSYIGGDLTDDIYVFLQAGHTVYRCSQSENVWLRVDTSPDPTHFEFSAPLEKLISKCVTGSHGCKFVLFSDNTAIRIFNSPDEPPMVTILSHAATFLDQHDCNRLLTANDNMSETPIIHACPA